MRQCTYLSKNDKLLSQVFYVYLRKKDTIKYGKDYFKMYTNINVKFCDNFKIKLLITMIYKLKQGVND